MSRSWVISDTHFGHTNLLKYIPDRGRRWKTAHAMNKELTERWNSVVKPNDTVYHLGDFWLGKSHPSRYLTSLNGNIVLLPGNHDVGLLKLAWEYFARILPSPYPMGRGVVFSHAPIHPSCLSNHRGWMLNVHGHIHTRNIPDGRYFNVCAEQIDYTPMPMEDVYDLLKKVKI